jgi:hypothetical protein
LAALEAAGDGQNHPRQTRVSARERTKATTKAKSSRGGLESKKRWSKADQRRHQNRPAAAVIGGG